MKTIFYFLALTSFVFGQENFGSLNSNYMPTNSVLINPSSMLDAKTRIDINLASVSEFLMNNLIYLENTSAYSIIKNKQYENYKSLDTKLDLGNRKYHLYNRTRIQGPSFTFSQGDHAFGIGFSVNNYTDFRRMGKDVTLALASISMAGNKMFSANNVAFTSIVYGDMKFSYAVTLKKKKRELFMAGISVSKFFPYRAVASKINSMDAELMSDSSIYIHRIDADNTYAKKNNVSLNSGFGIDIGFTYQRMLAEAFNYLPNSKRNNCRRNYYLYKIGVSIMDIGHLKFNRKKLNYQGIMTEDYDVDRSEVRLDNINFFDKLHKDQEVRITRQDATIRKLNKMRLPTYLSIQADYNAWKNKLYFNFTMVQRIKIGEFRYGVERANSMCLTPRFETQFFEFALPLSLYEYKTPQIGVCMRIWGLTIGTDKLMNMFVKSDLYGADLYVALKIPVVYHPSCRDGSRDKLNYYPERYKWRSKGCGL